MKNYKCVLAALALGISANAAAMPEQVPDRYYDHKFSWVFAILGIKKPCTGPGTICNPYL